MMKLLTIAVLSALTGCAPTPLIINCPGQQVGLQAEKPKAESHKFIIVQPPKDGCTKVGCNTTCCSGGLCSITAMGCSYTPLPNNSTTTETRITPKQVEEIMNLYGSTLEMRLR